MLARPPLCLWWLSDTGGALCTSDTQAPGLEAQSLAPGEAIL